MRRIVLTIVIVVGCLSVFIVAKPPFGIAQGRQVAARTETATFAAGCFWGVEDAFRRLDGVISTTSGFTGGHIDRPTYRQVSTGDTGHAEAVRVTFDPKRISYAELLDAFWSCHDPTRERDGDEPHRSIVFFHGEQQELTALASRDELTRTNAFDDRAITTDIRPATDFFPADEEHQQYLAKLGRTATCSVGERPIRTRLATAAAARRAGD